MFDTSVVRSHAVAAPRRFGLFAASVAVHSGVVFAAMALTLASTQLPSRSPNQMEIYRPVVLPTVPPAYGQPHARKPESVAAPVKQQPAVQSAPNSIPDQTLPVNPSSGNGPAVGPVGTGDAGPIGVPWGDPNSVNPLDATPEPVVAHPPEVTYTPGGEVKAARVLRRVEPRYPSIMLSSRMAAIVTVHCVIDKSGSIRDAQIVKSSFPPFNEAVLDAVRQWSFAPGTMRGQPVDTYFELTVKFVVQ